MPEPQTRATTREKYFVIDSELQMFIQLGKERATKKEILEGFIRECKNLGIVNLFHHKICVGKLKWFTKRIKANNVHIRDIFEHLSSHFLSEVCDDPSTITLI